MTPSTSFAIALGVFLAMIYFFFLRAGRISGPVAKQLVEDGARLVDVRSPGEYASGHIPGAINIPVQELSDRVGELAPSDKAIVLYCQSGMRSASAARFLKAAGYKNVHNLGAMRSWG
jgi:phage shock protein E